MTLDRGKKGIFPTALLSSVTDHWVTGIQGKLTTPTDMVCLQFDVGSPEESLGFGIYMGQFSASSNGFLQVRADEKTAAMYFRIIEILVIFRLQNALKAVKIFLSWT